MLALLVLLACGEKSDQPVVSGPPVPAATVPGTPTDGAAVVARWEGGQITYTDMQSKISSQIAKMEVEYLQNRYNTERQTAEQMATEAVFEAEAKKRGVSVDDLLKTEIEDKVAKPTDAEVAEFYPVVSRQLRNAPLEQVKDQVAQALTYRRQAERMQAYVEELKATYKLTIDVPYPDLPRIQVSVDDDPAIGDANAPITIVEFADFQCGYCRKIYPTLRELIDEYPGKIRLVYRDYPLGGPNPAGMSPIIAANCAGAQGKYWEMHDALMKGSGFSEQMLTEKATAAGVDIDQWKACMANPTAQVEEISRDFNAGQEVGVSGTPAFFINGVFLNGAVPKEQFESVINRELSGS